MRRSCAPPAPFHLVSDDRSVDVDAAVIGTADMGVLLRLADAVGDDSLLGRRVEVDIGGDVPVPVEVVAHDGDLLTVATRARVRPVDERFDNIGKLVTELDGQPALAAVTNVSCQGIGLQTGHRFEPEDLVEATVHLHHPIAVSFSGTMEIRWGKGRRSGRAGNYGARWVELDDVSSDALVGWVFARLAGLRTRSAIPVTAS